MEVYGRILPKPKDLIIFRVVPLLLVTWENRALPYNELLADYCRKHEDCMLLCYSGCPLFFEDPKDVGNYRKVRTDIFIEDGVNLNRIGYELFAEFIRNAMENLL